MSEAAAAVESPVSSSPPRDAVFLGLTLGQVILMVAWPVLLLVAAYSFVLVKKEAVLEAAIRARPAIKVVDVTQVMRTHIAQGLTADQAITASNSEFQKLGQAGYVVIDANSVLAAPANTELH